MATASTTWSTMLFWPFGLKSYRTSIDSRQNFPFYILKKYIRIGSKHLLRTNDQAIIAWLTFARGVYQPRFIIVWSLSDSQCNRLWCWGQNQTPPAAALSEQCVWELNSISQSWAETQAIQHNKTQWKERRKCHVQLSIHQPRWQMKLFNSHSHWQPHL